MVEANHPHLPHRVLVLIAELERIQAATEALSARVRKELEQVHATLGAEAGGGVQPPRAKRAKRSTQR